jgi:3-phenylpropionate/cinnamic acid dioxygenase small subunit
MIDDAKVLAAINGLQVRYARALDTRHMEGWLDCFDGDGGYVCISKENEEQGLKLALMMDDSPERLCDRVVLSDGVARLRSRRAVLDAAVVPRYLVYPV